MVVSWFAWALLAGLTSAANVWLSRGLAQQGLSPLWVGGSLHLLGAAVTLPLVWVQGWGPLPQLQYWVGLSLAVGIAALGNACFFAALRGTQLSEIDVLLRSSALWTFLGGVVLLAEPAHSQAWLGLALIVLATGLVSQRGSFRFSRPQGLALAAALFFGMGNLADRLLSPQFSAAAYTFLNQLLIGLALLALGRVPLQQWFVSPLRSWAAWGVGISFALTQGLLVLAYQAGGGAGQVILVAQLRLVLLVLVGLLWLGERDRVYAKLGAVGLVLAGLFVLQLQSP